MAVYHLVSYSLGLQITGWAHLLQAFARRRFPSGAKQQPRAIAVAAMHGGGVSDAAGGANAMLYDLVRERNVLLLFC